MRAYIEPTARQKQVLATIRRLTKRKSHPPTTKEIGQVMGVGKARVTNILTRLRTLGFASWQPGKSRTLRATMPLLGEVS